MYHRLWPKKKDYPVLLKGLMLIRNTLIAGRCFPVYRPYQGRSGRYNAYNVVEFCVGLEYPVSGEFLFVMNLSKKGIVPNPLPGRTLVIV